jgi:23S rRNA (pseudouridine1915-N3)-methyltransferase
MRVRILCVGRLKEGFYRAACGEYLKRLQKYATVEVVEVADESAPEKLSDALRDQVLLREAQRLIKQQKGDVTVALCIEGAQEDSLTFARRIDGYERAGVSCVEFLIGGSLGLHASLVKAADATLSLSALTFPHNLARVVLLEQLYRAMKINRGEPYHK